MRATLLFYYINIDGAIDQSLLDIRCAHVAQLDRVPGYEPGGRRFDSFHARHSYVEIVARM